MGIWQWPLNKVDELRAPLDADSLNEATYGSSRNAMHPLDLEVKATRHPAIGE
jgi:hypothetical protein